MRILRQKHPQHVQVSTRFKSSLSDMMIDSSSTLMPDQRNSDMSRTCAFLETMNLISTSKRNSISKTDNDGAAPSAGAVRPHVSGVGWMSVCHRGLIVKRLNLIWVDGGERRRKIIASMPRSRSTSIQPGR